MYPTDGLCNLMFLNDLLNIGPSGCVRCHGNKVSTINGVIFLGVDSLVFFWKNEKCLELPEMARKLTPPKKNKKMG